MMTNVFFQGKKKEGKLWYEKLRTVINIER